ncbi:hypothetical protein C1J03_23105 [Sulfitobacter sp. SK012]|uniref:hypothetical protein n=1 Tax=Sulfitobacter sp. SK012 TaxID=1389005 RepID=UPI000E0B7DB5|nr:hypothetical protein [Sulfitobacter sp. SK012]AXI48632.1 hypothetical protein C1J03_23105 [Sulfitobacter sp. SK012]
MRALWVLILLPSFALAGPYDGRYRPDVDVSADWDCTTIGQDGGAIAIANGAFFGVESRCALQNETAVRDMDATLFDLVCSGEGEAWQRRVMVMKTQSGIAMIENGGTVMRLRRCE